MLDSQGTPQSERALPDDRPTGAPTWLRLWRNQVLYASCFLGVCVLLTSVFWWRGGLPTHGPQIARIAGWVVALGGPVGIVIWSLELRALFRLRRTAPLSLKASAE